MADRIGHEFLRESKKRIDHARGRINHCFDQLSDEDIWWVPVRGCNCIGVLVQHLVGNLRQWVLSGVGGAPDTRDRAREFLADEKRPKPVVQGELNETLDRVVEVCRNLDPSLLLDQRRIQGFDASVLSAIYRTMTHLELHAGQIAHLTRMRLGDAYQLWWTKSR